MFRSLIEDCSLIVCGRKLTFRRLPKAPTLHILGLIVTLLVGTCAYGLLAPLLAVAHEVVVLATAGFVGWQYWTASKADRSGDDFAAALTLANSGKNDDSYFSRLHESISLS